MGETGSVPEQQLGHSTLGLPPLRGARVLVAVLLIYALVSRVFVATIVPAWQGPDEPKHFEYPRLLVDKWGLFVAQHRLPTPADASPELQTQIIASMAQHHFWEYLGQPTPPTRLPKTFLEAFGGSYTQLHRFSLYYVLAALTIAPLQADSIDDQLLAMRLLSAVLGALAVLPAYALLRLIAPHDAFVPIAGAAFVAALPMSVYIGGMMTNDNLLLLLGMLAALGMVSGLVRGFSVRTWALTLGAVVLGLLTKRGAVILLPGVLVCGVVGLARLHDPLRRWLAVGTAGAALAMCLAAASGLLGRLLPLEEAQAALIAYALNGLYQWQDLQQVPLLSPRTVQIVGTQLDAYFRSFWGIFGWFTVLLRSDVYDLLRVVTGVCALGCLAWCSGWFSPRLVPAARRFALMVVLSILVVSGIVAGVAERLAYYSPTEVPQGRYLFIVLGPIAAVFALGLRVWLPRPFVGTLLPTVAVLGLLVAFDALAYLTAIQPYFGRFSG